MLLSTRRIPTKYLVILGIIALTLLTGYIVIPMGFSYKLNHTRTIPPPNKELETAILQGLSDGFDPQQRPFEATLERSNDIVAALLEYDFTVSETDPNKVFKIRKVNCAGYAALQVCVLNYIFKNYGFAGCHAEWHSGKVYYCGQWLGRYLGFHCYPVVKVKNGETYYPDACFNDLFHMDSLVGREEQ